MPPTHERVLTGRPDLAAAERRLAASLPLCAARARTLDRVLLDVPAHRSRARPTARVRLAQGLVRTPLIAAICVTSPTFIVRGR